jgi:hypothetical protein
MYGVCTGYKLFGFSTRKSVRACAGIERQKACMPGLFFSMGRLFFRVLCFYLLAKVHNYFTHTFGSLSLRYCEQVTIYIASFCFSELFFFGRFLCKLNNGVELRAQETGGGASLLLLLRRCGGELRTLMMVRKLFPFSFSLFS